MSEDTIIVAIVFGSILGFITIPLLISLIKTWINRNKNTYDEEKFDRLAKAFIKYKKDSERRLQNLEAGITDENSASASSSTPELEQTQLHHTIEVNSDEEPQKKKESGGGNLRNMLKE